ncbi:MAG: response regulator, partial [Myxococcota bacterium]
MKEDGAQQHRVLVVEDDRDVRGVLALLIREERLALDEVASAAEALERLASDARYAVVIVDWTLPDGDGARVLEAVRQRPTVAPRPSVLVVTGRTDGATVEAALAGGADDFLGKPFPLDAFETRLRLAVRAFEERVATHRADPVEGARYKTAFEAMLRHGLEGYALVDPEGVVRLANAKLEELVASAGGLVGTALATHLGPEAAAALTRLEETADEAVTLELPLSDGRTLELTASPPFDLAGDLVRLFALRDVSERRRLEAQLAQADRLGSLGTLAAGVAHEVNNPLGYLSANLDYLAESLKERGPSLPEAERAEVLAALAEARDGAARVAQIVSDLGRFGRGDDGLPAESRRPVDLTLVLRKAVKMTRNELRHRGTLTEDLQKVPPVNASEGRLLQVFVNLLTNAAQALDERAASTNRVEVRCWAEGPVVYAEVADSGPGIAPEHRDRVFEPFYSTKGVGTGTGLGLSICHGILTGLGGGIELRPGLRGGAAFRVAIPAARPRDRHSSAPPPPRENLPTRARLLVIDDERLVGRALQRALAAHEVVAVQDPDEGLRRFLSEPFDLCICDLMMPGLSGMELHARVTHRAPELAERMVFMTGGAFTPRSRAFLEELPNRTIEKPFGIEMVRA